MIWRIVQLTLSKLSQENLSTAQNLSHPYHLATFKIQKILKIEIGE